MIVGSYDPSDTAGSGGDVFAWYGLVILLFAINAIIQIVVIIFGKFSSLLLKICVLISSVVIAAASMLWVHNVGIY